MDLLWEFELTNEIAASCIYNWGSISHIMEPERDGVFKRTAILNPDNNQAFDMESSIAGVVRPAQWGSSPGQVQNICFITV